MPLADHVFSDLIILPDGEGRLKGLRGSSEQLSHVPADCREEISALPNLLTAAALEKERPDPSGCMLAQSGTFRFPHGGVFYRVASVRDVEGKGRNTWFLRRLPATVPSLHDLGLMPYVADWLLAPEQRQGFVLFSGPQCSGKTTCASAFLRDRISLYGGHAVTFEIPSELPLAGSWGERGGYCFQLEISCERDLAAEIEKAHRYAAPNIIMIGEIRTQYAAVEALRIALGSGNQIVVATIHGLDVCSALDRLANWAKEIDGGNAYRNLATSLLAAIHLDLRDEAGKRALRTPEFLLAPFTESSGGIRGKLRDNEIIALKNDMREQKNRISNNMGLAS